MLHSVKVAFADNIDLVILNHHSEEGIRALQARNPRVRWMLYNQATRYRMGFYIHRTMDLGGQGHFQFMLSSPGADPYYALDAREDDYCGLFLRADGNVTETVGMSSTSMLKAALLDIRYGLSLDQEIAQATSVYSSKVATSSNSSETSVLAAALLHATNLRRVMRQMMPIGRGKGKYSTTVHMALVRKQRRNVYVYVYVFTPLPRCAASLCHCEWRCVVRGTDIELPVCYLLTDPVLHITQPVCRPRRSRQRPRCSRARSAASEYFRRHYGPT